MLRLIIIVFAGLLYACGARGSSEQSTMQLTEADNGRSIELRVGNQLEVTLPGNPTTGFQWEVSDVDSIVLTPIGEPEFKPSNNAVGSGGNLTLRFEAVGAGQTELKLIYHRAFEVAVPPAQTFQVTVTIK